MDANLFIAEALSGIHQRLDHLEYEVKLIKAKLDIEDTAQSEREKEHHMELLNENRAAESKQSNRTVAVIGALILALMMARACN